MRELTHSERVNWLLDHGWTKEKLADRVGASFYSVDRWAKGYPAQSVTEKLVEEIYEEVRKGVGN